MILGKLMNGKYLESFLYLGGKNIFYKKTDPIVKMKVEMLYLHSVFKTGKISAGEMGEWLKPHVC